MECINNAVRNHLGNNRIHLYIKLTVPLFKRPGCIICMFYCLPITNKVILQKKTSGHIKKHKVISTCVLCKDEYPASSAL